MKKHLFTLAVIAALLGGVSPVAAQTAATISVLPSTVVTNANKTFAVAVSINPEDATVYSAKIQVNYPADLLEFKSFAYNKDVMAVMQPGYDSVDQTNGVVVKTAGIPGGSSGPFLLGTLSFTAKKAGVAQITIGNGSMILDGRNQNVHDGEVALGTITVLPSQVATASSGSGAARVSARPAASVALPNAGQVTTGSEVATTSTTTLGTGGPESIFDTGSLVGGDAGDRLGAGGRWTGFAIGLVILAILIGIVYAISSRRRL
jgi:hypothetical protein